MKQKVVYLLRRIAPKTTRCHRIWTGPNRGGRIVTSWNLYPSAILGWTERPLLCWFKKNARAGETWLDIGANFGYTAIALSRLVGPQGRVYAFEPKLSTAGCLARTAEVNHYPQLLPVPLALGNPDDVSIRSMTVVRGMLDGILELGPWSESICIARLDWLWPKLCGGKDEIHGVKIDVQGMELEVLRGMRQLLLAHHPKLVIEVHQNIDRSEFTALLLECGYRHHPEVLEPGDASDDDGDSFKDNKSYAFIADVTPQRQPGISHRMRHGMEIPEHSECRNTAGTDLCT